VENGVIHYALAALKGVGAQAVKAIIAGRRERPFRDLADFAQRVTPQALNKRVLESLVAAGAFDSLEGDRSRAFAAIDAILGTAQRHHESASVGQNELFGGATARDVLSIPPTEPWVPAEKLKREFDAIGFFLSGHPLDDYAAALKRLRIPTWAEFVKDVKNGLAGGKVAGTVVSKTERRTRTGTRMGIVGLSDPSGHFEAVIFSEGLQQHRDLLEPGRALLVSLSTEMQGDEVRARIQGVEPLDQAAAKVSAGLRVFMRSPAPLDGVARRLEGRGEGEVSMVLMLDGGTEVEVKLPGRFKVSPQIAGAIKAVPGVVAVDAI
jgi:DNA polymerase III subunit alpha